MLKKTTVSVHKSQDEISKVLRELGARGVQFTDNFDENKITIRFAKEVDGNLRTVTISPRVPDPPKSRKTSKGKKSQEDQLAQMKRATYRAVLLLWKAQLAAIEYGIISFEDMFLSHFEWMLDGKTTTVGEIVKAGILNSLQLPANVANSDDVVDAEPS